jgi:enoyl-[acyl-carrier protein] reductase II
MSNRITDLFKIKYPIISGGMVWVSGGKLAAAVSNAGGLGLIGAGSMKPDLLKDHILKAQSLTKSPIGVNVPLLYKDSETQIKTALDLGINIFFTSAGSPKKYTQYLKDQKAIVVHVTSTPELATKCEEAGVDAIVAEGFEAGGHNGRDELTTLTLIPQVKSMVKIPIIAAGGIASGSSMLAAMIIGADAIQMGTRFLMTKESSAHDNFKNLLLNSPNSSTTKLLMKKTVPVRLFNNKFSTEIETIESQYLGDELKQKLEEHLGHGRAKNGMLLGDLENGELEIGQIVSMIKNIPTCQELIDSILLEYQTKIDQIKNKSLI